MSNTNKILSPEEVAKQNLTTGVDTIEKPTTANAIVAAVPIVEEIKEPVEKKEESHNVPPEKPTGKLKKFFILTWKMSSYSIYNVRVEKGTPLEFTGKTKKAINYMVKQDIWKVIEK